VFEEDGRFNEVGGAIDHYDIGTCPVGVFELPVLLEHVQMQTIGGSRIRVHYSFGALSSLRLSWSFISIPTSFLPSFPTYGSFCLLSRRLPAFSLFTFMKIGSWHFPESPDVILNMALPNILTGASFFFPFSSLLTTLKNDSWHPLEPSGSRIDLTILN
jgi:hypothetical protein